MSDEREGDFWTSDVTKDFNFVNHNDTDYEGFRDFAKEIDERFASIEQKRERIERQAALEKWDRALPDRWKDAKFSLIKKPVVQKILASMTENPKGSFFLYGGSGVGKTFVAYALIRRLIGRGIANSQQVKQISESVLIGWATQGFKGADRFSEVFDPRYRIYFFDGIGSLSDAEADKVAALWEQLIDHIFTKDLVAIFTSADDLDRFASLFSPSGETKLRTLVAGRDFVVESDGSIATKKSDN